MPEGKRQARTVANDGRRANRRQNRSRRDRDRSRAQDDDQQRNDDARWVFADVQAAYAACLRCGYFLSGYRLTAGKDVLDAAIENIRGAWLELPWTPTMRELLEKSFGTRLDSDVYHFKGQCGECARVFVVRSDDPGAEPLADDELDETEPDMAPTATVAAAETSEIEGAAMAADASAVPLAADGTGNEEVDESHAEGVEKAATAMIENEPSVESTTNAARSDAGSSTRFRIQIRPRAR